MTNLERYKKDLTQLIEEGGELQNAIVHECLPSEFTEQLKDKLSQKEINEFIKKLPSFKLKYQSWYSEALAVIKVLLPDRVSDFISKYKKPSSRKSISYENYAMEDYLQGLTVTSGYINEKVVGPDAAIPQFQQQLNILRAAEKRFESSLFDIKQLLQADLFDSELDAAKELNLKGFSRGAGAVAGVVLEKHLSQVCEEHKLKINKKDPSLNDLNQTLKDGGVLEVKDWRFIQRLADLRNLCDHNKKMEPKKEDVGELIDGVAKIIKILY